MGLADTHTNRAASRLAPTAASTPGPWEAPGLDGDAFVVCTDKLRGKRRTVAHAYLAGDAELIVRAVNVHHDMLAALKLIASHSGLTLIAPSLGDDADKGHQLGALKAFNQMAEIAQDALAKISDVGDRTAPAKTETVA